MGSYYDDAICGWFYTIIEEMAGCTPRQVYRRDEKNARRITRYFCVVDTSPGVNNAN